jgi:hypothetical protein
LRGTIRDKAARRYDWNRIVDQVEGLILRVLGGEVTLS